MTIPAKTRRSIEAIFDVYGRDIAMKSDDTLPVSTLFVVGPGDAGEYKLVGSVRNINWAIDVRDNALVPECYDDEASTWG
jgi:hypothetical protein